MAFRLEKPLTLFSPLKVAAHFRKLCLEVPHKSRTKAFRKAVEANFVAESLAGRRAMDGRDYWLRIVDDQEESPDIKTYCRETSGSNKFEEHFVEVTEYEEHSNDQIVDFLLRTKLSKYNDPKLIVLCALNQNFTLPKISELETELVSKGLKNILLFLGRISPELRSSAKYKLVQVDPRPEKKSGYKDFILDEELQKMDYEGVLILDNNREPGKYPQEKHFPFETIGFIPNDKGTYE